jgi:hypothetical protein
METYLNGMVYNTVLMVPVNQNPVGGILDSQGDTKL